MAAKKEEPKEIIITSVRNNRKSVQIGWTQGADKYPGVEFHDNPLPSFFKAIAALTKHVCSLCEFPEKDEAKIEATGITVAAKGDNNLALIVAKKKIKRGGRIFNISTPLLAMYPDKEDKKADCMDADEAKAIEKVITEAKKYVMGDRAQGQIKFEEEKPAAAKGGENTSEFPALTVEDGGAGGKN